MVTEKVVYMIRHGKLVNSHEGVLNGQSDTLLSEEGFRETILWLDFLKNEGIDIVLSSDLSRTKKPAIEYSKRLKVPHHSLKELREIDAGLWELKSMKEIIENNKDYFIKRLKNPANVPFPGGESLKNLKKRAFNCLKNYLDTKYNKILYIGHAGVIRVLILSSLNLPLKNFFKLEVDFGSLSILRFFSDGNVVLKTFNMKAIGR